jgi:hypothetical protein
MAKSYARDQVADAWKAGKVMHAASISTDGQRIYSYGHEIGFTVAGAKVAIHCNYSKTTQIHCGAAARVADAVEECSARGQAHRVTPAQSATYGQRNKP